MARPKDETYVIDLCDEILGQKASRGHRFDFLRGDPTKRGIGVALPVDAYYPALKLVLEYHERQHCESVPFFDRKIVSTGITRGAQRKKYDLLRIAILPQNGITLLILCYKEFGHSPSKRLLRTSHDREVVRIRLERFLPSTDSR